VNVQVKDGLACARAVINNGSIARIGQPLLVRKSGGDPEQVAEQRFLSLRSLVKGFNVLARDYEKVRGRLRVDVAYGH
jgi:hypothetical protein